MPIAQATAKFLAVVQVEKIGFVAISLLQFYDAAKSPKKAFTEADRALDNKQFYKHDYKN